jgi:outer membrane protein assembly factor BamB
MTMKAIHVVVVASLSLGSLAFGADWPQFRGPNRDGISVEKGWFKTGTTARTVWEGQVGAGYSAVAIRGDRLYTMGNREGQDVVSCLDAATGKGLWVYSYPCQKGSYAGPRCTPTVEGGNVYTVSREGLILCLDAEKGSVRWQRAPADEPSLKLPQWGLAGSPLVAGDLLIVNEGAHGLALDKTTGKTQWASGGAGGGYASPVHLKLEGLDAVLVFAAKAVVAVELATGKELWSHTWNTSYDVNAADPLVMGDKVFISSGYGRGGALLQVTGAGCKVAWENKNLASQFSTPVWFGSAIYGINGNTGRGEVCCIDPATGAVRWSRKESGFGSLMLADGKLIILNEKGTLSVAEATPEGYRELWSQTVLDGVCWTMPTLCNGLIYCRTDKGRLVCVDANGK